MEKTPAIMVQGTGSDVGKSLLVAGLCRAFTKRGLSVRPFKPQNMSNNAAVTADGGEIGRAQALQARACGVPATTDMNPVLLKPQSEVGAQVVVQGRILGNAKARDYQAMKGELLPKVLESFRRLGDEADLVIVEGAGSPAEVNLRNGDIANMGFAEAADLPVILVADIDRGGVIATLVGSHVVLGEAEAARIAGYVVNKFRGDVSLFDEGLAIITARTGWPSLGVVPFFPAASKLPAEDAVALSRAEAAQGRAIKVAVPQLARIANFDDLDPLIAEPDVAVDFVEAGRALPGDADLVVLPGSKATLADLAFLRAQGWDIDLAAHLRRGGRVLGICGGYQMLGRRVADPEGIEGPRGREAEGLGLLDVETVLTGDKALKEVRGIHLESAAALQGYEMHVGVTQGAGLTRPFLDLANEAGGSRREGAVSADGKVAGCYLHGLFAADAFRAAFLGALKDRAASGLAYDTQVEAVLDQLAAHLEAHLDLDRVLDIARGARRAGEVADFPLPRPRMAP
ncbi:cobyric acid synthase [Pelagibius marinus]|uniref:cobyric acid synthase n=1 Tax=Pelagibius marinus TaxID=2762760 RepID=UPI001D05A938|nr:cobyric acid synthase [Pelagibius marinus]